MNARVETYILEVIRRKRKGFFSTFLRLFLFLLSIPYFLVMKLRNWAFDKKWLKQYSPPIPVVISVGNIVAGGTGKTPTLLMLAAHFYGERSLGILSRGYRSLAEKLPSPVVVCSGKGPLHSAAYCGDEPYLLAKNLPKSYICVGKNRHKSANMAAKAGVEIVILDDGMQHRSIGRDYEIVVMDADDPFGLGHHLPRGLLRESPRSLARASLIIVNHVGNPEQFASAKEKIAAFSRAPVIGTRMEIERICDFQGNAIESIKEKRVGLFCGIGQPDRFIQTVRDSGAQIVGQHIFPDHASYDPDQIIKMADRFKAQGAEMIVCTEKDRVKIPDIPHLSLLFVWFKMKLMVIENETDWLAFLSKIKNDLHQRA